MEGAQWTRPEEATMLTAHPSLLRELVAQCETLRWRLAHEGGVETARRLEDVTYTLCVITGTRCLDKALSEARRQLLDARAEQQAPGR
jgi:uncharacterized protein DUF5133